MAKEELIEMSGKVDEMLPDTRYRVTLDNGHKLIAYTSGKMRKHRIPILAGDNVTLEMPPCDLHQRPNHLLPHRKPSASRCGSACFQTQALISLTTVFTCAPILQGAFLKGSK